MENLVFPVEVVNNKGFSFQTFRISQMVGQGTRKYFLRSPKTERKINWIDWFIELSTMWFFGQLNSRELVLNLISLDRYGWDKSGES